MKDQDKVWVYKACVILVTGVLFFGITSHVAVALSAKIARAMAHLPNDVTLTQHFRPSTYVFSDGTRINIGNGWEALSGFAGFIAAALVIFSLWWLLAGIMPKLHRAAFPMNNKMTP
jgi:hypothetical protein